MIITHNLPAMSTSRIVNANIEAHAKSTSKISSGYGINRAVDNPSGLAISETMRRQIRGLMQGINNTKDGVAFVQIADGAMDEIHAMLQRMNELSLKSLNGLCTAEDRLALNAEFDQLRTEIDRINDTTTFNTQPVFDNHEASYYQIRGNRQWKDNQLHTISSTANELNIHLPDNYDPKDYTLTIPAGTYTTQELMDEIDDALAKMDPPNPGFVFEYTSDGYCNLNFESAEGKPTNIAMVDGSLSYLIYDFQPGGSPASLLGTSPFEYDKNGNPRQLHIVKGQNDELGFYAESAEGDRYISITIPDRYYTRDEMIAEINKQLEKIDDAKGITAKQYGDYYIQITGGNTINITGLKGNMFKCDPKGSPTYTSVFYDNVVYGSSVADNAEITGHRHTKKIKIYGDTQNQNNILYFKLKDNDVRTITLPVGEYTVPELTSKINELLYAEGLSNEIEAKIDLTTGSLKLFSKINGGRSQLSFEIGSDVDSVNQKIYENTYKTLFLSTSGTPSESGRPASVEGNAYLNGAIELPPDATLSFTVEYKGGKKDYTIGKEFIGGKHTDLKALVNKLNSFVASTPDLQGKIEFVANGNRLFLESKTDDITNFSFPDKNETAYQKLLTGSSISQNGSFSGKVQGSKKEDEGHPGVYIISPASINASPCKLPVTIDDNNNEINLYLDNPHDYGYITLKLDSGTYSNMNALIGAINKKLGESNSSYAQYIKVEATSGSTLKFTFTPPESNTVPDGKWNISLDHSSAWNAIFGTSQGIVSPIIRPAMDSELRSYYQITDSIEISSQCKNNKLWFNFGGTEYEITIDDIICNGREDIYNALQNAIDKSVLKDTVKVSLDRGYLCLSTTSAKVLAVNSKGEESTFYNEVLCKGLYGSPSSYKPTGTCNYESPHVIGRRDLTTEPINIMAGFNDTLTFDFTHSLNGNSVVTPISVTIPEGNYRNGYELVNVLNAAIKQQFGQNGDLSKDSIFGVDGDFDLSFSIGGYQTEVYGNIDQFALQITANRKPGKEPENGNYIIDGVRGNASCYVFYKTASLPTATYIVGTKDIRDGITFEPEKNVLTLSANSIPYKYTFEKDKYYTAEEFIDELNKRFEEGDDDGNPAPLRATLEDGAVKIWHKTLGANTITDIGGSARGTIFFEEEGRDSRDPLIIQAGAEQRSTIELPRIRVDSCSLGINSITISKEKYAEKAVEHIKSAIKQLSGRRSTYGAMQNRLEHTINNNENVSEQVQASESRIRDTDMSTELIRYSNLNILLKAGHKMITYSNNRIQKLLTILE